MNDPRIQLTSLARRTWLHQIWKYKASFLAGSLAIVSLSLAHYAGFLMDVPLQIVAIAGALLAKDITATFLFYMFFSAVSARVLTSILQLVVLPFLAAADRLERGMRRKMSWAQQRRFVRSHTETIKWEGLAWVAFQILLFLFVMLGIYVKFTVTWISGVGLFVSMILATMAGLVRSGFFLQPKLKPFVRKIRTRRARLGKATSATFVTATSALIIGAFFMGFMRASLLREQKPHMILTKEFTGMAAVIASSEDALLLFQRQGKEFRYIYSTREFAITIETKPVFQPLSPKQ